jgi:hypothetical protein
MKPEEEWGPADHMAITITFIAIIITIGVIVFLTPYLVLFIVAHVSLH